MMLFNACKFRPVVLLIALALAVAGCRTPRYETFYGKTKPPSGQVMRYVTGSEPGSLNPQKVSSQSAARICVALFEGLCEFDPKTLDPIPAIAERWEVNKDSSEYVFHLRKNARWSDGEQITAQDFLYSFRRGVSPKTASTSADLGYPIKYAQAYNERKVFIRDPDNNTYLLEKDFALEPEKDAPVPEATPFDPATEYQAMTADATPAPDTEFHHYIHSPNRLTLPDKEDARAKAVQANPKLAAALAGKSFVFEPVRAEDIGVEAVDDFTFRITLTNSSAIFLNMLPHPFFRIVPQKAIERYNDVWAQPEHIVTNGPFKLKTWTPYQELIVVRDPNYWDAARVQLDEIRFYPMEENSQIMGLYEAGEVDATYNHTVPVAWLDRMRLLKDYMDAPEAATTYYMFNVTKPPMNDVLVRRAFNMAIDKVTLATWRKAGQPLTGVMPEALFPGYPLPKGEPFDPVKAKQLLAQAGYRDAAGNYDPQKFPVDKVEIIYNRSEAYQEVSEFLQAQWMQNLGLTVPLEKMEFKTLLDKRNQLDYQGIVRGDWVADYIDPYNFLNVFRWPKGSGTGWYDKEFVKLLDEANRAPDQQRRYEILAKAEARLLAAQPLIPLMTNSTNWMKKPYVKGMYPNLGTMHAWKFVCIEHDPARWDYGIPSLSYESQSRDFKEREKELPVCTK